MGKTPFLLGDRPSLADLGIMNAMFGRLYRDPGEICDHVHWHCISLSLWIDHMPAAAGESDRGELYITPSLENILAGFKAPYAERAMRLLQSADETLPSQPLGTIVPITNGDGSHYTAWRCQRLGDQCLAVPQDQVSKAERLLDLAGFLEACQHQTDRRLEKRELSLVVV